MKAMPVAAAKAKAEAMLQQAYRDLTGPGTSSDGTTGSAEEADSCSQSRWAETAEATMWQGRGISLKTVSDEALVFSVFS